MPPSVVLCVRSCGGGKVSMTPHFGGNTMRALRSSYRHMPPQKEQWIVHSRCHFRQPLGALETSRNFHHWQPAPRWRSLSWLPSNNPDPLRLKLCGKPGDKEARNNCNGRLINRYGKGLSSSSLCGNFDSSDESRRECLSASSGTSDQKVIYCKFNNSQGNLKN